MENTDKIIELLGKQMQKLDDIGDDLTPWEANTNSILRRAFNDPHINVYDHRAVSLDGDNSYAKKQLRDLLEGYIDQIKGLGLPQRTDKKIGHQINISNNINISIVIESLRDELNGKQISELKASYEKGTTPDEKKKNIVATIKTFGSDVASNILASILTNPSIFSGL